VKFQLPIAFVLLVACGTSLAADLAVLRNGNSIRHERREVLGPVTRLYLSASSNGYIEIPTDQIERFEKDTAPPPALPAYTAPATRVAPQKQGALTREALNQVVSGAGERNQIDPDFINSVIRAESGFHQNAVSRKGALGLMQLMPGTASQLGISNPFDPNSNVEGGTKYLRDLLVKYNFDVNKALAAYNAGPKRVDQYHGVPPYFETQAYISRIIRDFNRQKIAENPALAKKSALASKKAASTKHASAATPQSPSAASSRSQQGRRSTVPSATSEGPETASR
jgi:soluble lytic murein transglycosylase-like protein